MLDDTLITEGVIDEPPAPIRRRWLAGSPSQKHLGLKSPACLWIPELDDWKPVDQPGPELPSRDPLACRSKRVDELAARPEVGAAKDGPGAVPLPRVGGVFLTPLGQEDLDLAIVPLPKDDDLDRHAETQRGDRVEQAHPQRQLGIEPPKEARHRLPELDARGGDPLERSQRGNRVG